MATEDIDISNLSRSRPASHGGSKHRWLVWLILLALGVGVYFLVKKLRTSEAATTKHGAAGPQRVPVIVQPVSVGDIPVYLSGLGTVTAFNTVTVKTRIDGQILKIYFTEGQYVKQGDLLAEIDPRPYEVQLAQANGQLARDQAQLTNDQIDLERYKVLAKDGVITNQQLVTQEALVRQFDGTMKADQANVENAKLQLTYCRITAPIGGRVGLRLIDVGNMVHAGDTNGMLVITQVQPIAVLFTIPEDDLSEVVKRLRSGEKLDADAYDRSGQKKIASGKLIAIDNQIDPTTGTSRLKAVFENKDNSLYPDQFVNVRLLVQVKKNEVLIPTVAVQRGPQGTFVYVVKEDQTADTRAVKVGTTEGGETSIESGLSAGDQVVTDGMDKLRPGIEVEVKAPPSKAVPAL